MNPLWWYRDNLTGKRMWVVMKAIGQTYNHFDLRGKTILDVGADFGLSPMHFIDHGAKSVIAYSLERQRNWLKHRDVEWHKQKWDYSTHQADIFKIDCEGCEYGMPIKWYFRNFDKMYIAIHYFPHSADEFKTYRDYIQTHDGKLILQADNEWMYLVDNGVTIE
jgi:hypothetical protein